MQIDIVPIGDVPERLNQEISNVLRSEYSIGVVVTKPQSVPHSAFDRDRNQYEAGELVDLAAKTGQGKKSLGVTTVDLYYRDRNYVFGIAYLNGKGSIVSTHRLKKTTAGSNTTPSSDAVVERLQKEANHFAGNMLGLEHCSNDRCVMSFTSTVTGIDKQNKSLCGQCHRELISAHSSEPENQDLADIFGPGNDRETRVYTADREWARGDDSEKN